MKKRLLILAAAVLLLTLVLAIPASASKSFPIQGTMTSPSFDEFSAVQVGPLCLVTVAAPNIWTGVIEGTGSSYYRSLSKGPCDCTAGPVCDETFHWEGTIDATVLGQQGTIRFKCNGQHTAGEASLWAKERCVVLSATGGLAGLHANWEGVQPFPGGVNSYKGMAHFDPDK